METKFAYDMFANVIQAGDYINYPGRRGSDTYVRTAKVLNVVERRLEGESPEMVLKVAMAKYDGKITKIVKTTVSSPYRATVVPKSYIQNDYRYNCLLYV
jgi:hypothetical protein